MLSQAAKLVRELHAQLVLLIEQGRGESEEADTLRDQMDSPWYEMTPEEHIAFKESLR